MLLYEDEVIALIKRASHETDASDALRFAQAAFNVAQALSSIAKAKGTPPEQETGG